MEHSRRTAHNRIDIKSHLVWITKSPRGDLGLKGHVSVDHVPSASALMLHEASGMRLPRTLSTFVLVIGGGVAVVSALMSMIVLWFLFGDRFEDWWHRRAFNATLWRDQGTTRIGGDWPPRLCMVDDLLASGRLKGMTAGQVEGLLGPPTEATPHDVKNKSIYYYLGPERGFFRIDSETLAVDFGPDGRVTDQRIRRD